MSRLAVALGLACALAAASARGADAPPDAAPAPAGEAADTRLDELFAALAQAKTAEIAAPIEASIWAVWRETGSPTVALLMERGDTLIEAGDLDDALKLTSTIVELDPHFAEGWHLRATAHWLADDYGAAIADIERTLALEPRHFGALVGLGAILQATGDDAAALKAYDAALAVYPAMEAAKTAAASLRRKVEGERI